jgi:WD40 repeat protein/serine/threonine protein kinase
MGDAQHKDLGLTADYRRPDSLPQPQQTTVKPGDRSEPESVVAVWPQVTGYDILGELGRGGMGVVYKAVQITLGRLVALKMILSGAYAGKEDRDRFRLEAEAAARLQHPNLVQIYEVGEQDGRPFFSLEFIAGGSLEDRLTGTPMAPRQAAELIETLARAMHYAHQRGIIHRDLKPANVLMTADGTPKITDFGLAKRLDGSGGGYTHTGDILGTPAYMAPEQAAGRTREVGPATDVYALGTILYEALTARPQFLSESVTDVLDQVRRQDPVPPSRLQPKVPRDLETICLKCLEKEPHKRYASAEALADDLRRFLNREPVLARRTPTWERGLKWARRRPALAALLVVSVLAVLTILGGSLWYSARLSDLLNQANRQRARAEEMEAQKEAQRAKAEESSRRARNELVRLYVTNGMRLVDEGNPLAALPWVAAALWEEQHDASQANVHRTRLAAILRQCPRLVQLWLHEAPLTEAAFSPDGMRVVTASTDGIARIWETRGEKARGRILKHDAAVRQVSFSPDGSRVLTASDDHTARIWDAATGRPLVEMRHGDAVRHAFFSSPDGKRVLTCSTDGTARVWDAATGWAVAAAMPHGGVVRYAAFSADGSRVVTASEDCTARVWDVATGGALTPPLKHLEMVYRAAFSPDGRYIITASADDTARVWAVATGELVLPPLRRRDDVRQARFSPDGRRILTASDDGTARLWDAATGAPLTPPMRHGSAVKRAFFSPDGQWVVTASDDNTARVWNARTGEPRTCPLVHAGTVQTASLSRDGRYLLTASDDMSARLWDISLSRPPWHEGPCDRAKPQTGMSPDGRHRVDKKDNTTDNTAHIVEVETGHVVGSPLRHGSPITQAVFSPDGSKILTASEDDTVRVWEAADGTPVAAPLRHTGTVLDAAFSPDSQWIVTASTDQTARVWNVRTGQPITPELPHPKTVRRACFSADGRQVITECVDGKRRVWDLPRDERPADDLLQLARLLAGSQIDTNGGLIPVDPADLRRAWDGLRARYPDDFAQRPPP